MIIEDEYLFRDRIIVNYDGAFEYKINQLLIRQVSKMDYTQSKLSFRILKVLKYLRLYGFKRTLNKVRSAYHMKKEYAVLPVIDKTNVAGHVGILGCGNFSYSTIAHYLKKNYGYVIHGVMDLNLARAASLCEAYGANYYTDDAEKVISDDAINLVYIASNHASHAEYAIRALKNNKSVHIEKPPVVSDDQLFRLCYAMEHSKGSVGLGYNRPQSSLGQKVQKAIDSQSGPMMINWFIAAHELEDEHWYFAPEEGGRVLGNLCHWIDYTLSLIPEGSRFPVKITPATSNKFKSDFVISYEFADGSLAVLTMSSKGHTFEGVSERLSIHRGNVLISLMDFEKLTIKNLNKVKVINPIYRDHGHESAITRSYQNLQNMGGYTVKELWESGNLMLRTKEAVETESSIVAYGYDNNLNAPKANSKEVYS
ncbi:MAG: Gfo/Idh/MocA family oxidoreductase [Cycloclasticus sp.]|nr:Gfo/Idh/MocA family oxidoreductase [Cycloclasticus sp.]